jgi:putative membrane protein insertion efficiency factor
MTRWMLWLYKRGVSPALHAAVGMTGACRFQPTCSEYAALAVATHGPVRGSWLAVLRVLRCQPLCRGGFDPVPGTGYDGAEAEDRAGHARSHRGSRDPVRSRTL